eukprot:6116552-Pyramimonas_sp.AAC.1
MAFACCFRALLARLAPSEAARLASSRSFGSCLDRVSKLLTTFGAVLVAAWAPLETLPGKLGFLH